VFAIDYPAVADEKENRRQQAGKNPIRSGRHALQRQAH
jgi:hypothetical protein